MMNENAFTEMIMDSKNIATSAGELIRARCKDLEINDIIAFIFMRDISALYIELIKEEMPKGSDVIEEFENLFKRLMTRNQIRKNLQEIKRSRENATG